jgi:solute carrier family 13 (sodium-dependent dicarboxylate transporter), member 2/3/5
MPPIREGFVVSSVDNTCANNNSDNNNGSTVNNGSRKPQRSSGLIWIALSVLVAGTIALIPTPEGLSPTGQRVLAITLLATVLWTTEALPLAATGLGCVVLLAATGASASLTDALWGFAQPVPYFLYGVLVLGLAAGKSGLAARVACWFLSLARGRPSALYWQLILSFAALAVLLPSAATRTGVQCPIYHEALLMMKAGPGSRIGRAVMQAQAQLNRMGSNALLTGGMTPVTAAALLGGMGWAQWFALMSVPVYAILVLGAAALYLSYRPFEGQQSTTDLFEAQSALGNGGTKATQLRACAIVLGVSVLWLTDSWHHMDPALPALLGAVLVVAPGIGVLTWAEVERGVGVTMVFVTAASLSLAHAVVASGAAAWMGAWLVAGLQPFAGTPLLLVTLLLVVALVARIILSSITAYLTVLIPVAGALAQGVGLNPLVCGLLVTLVGDSVLYYAAQASSSLLPFQYGYISSRDILRFGLVMTAVAMFVGLFIALPYWAWLGQPLVVGR